MRPAGWKHNKETKEKISKALKLSAYWLGKKIPDKIKRKISKSLKGRIFTKIHRKRISLAQKGVPKPWQIGNKVCLGKHPSKETRERMRKSQLGRKHPKSVKDKIRKSNMGHLVTDRTRMKIARKAKIRMKNPKNNPNWQGGLSFEPYGIKFNDELREKIRKRDFYACQYCGVKQRKLNRKLACHHIDYDKTNNNDKNLISLCLKCHVSTNYKRSDWTKHFKSIIAKKPS